MIGRSSMLPIAMVVVIVFLALIAITTGRSNAPTVAGDDTYPHYVCKFNEYCEGDVCAFEVSEFVLYLEHLDGNPRLDMRRVNPEVTMTATDNLRTFETIGGEVRGTLTMYRDRRLDWVGASGPSDSATEHYATGECGRLQEP